MTFIEAFHDEVKEWDWVRMPAGAKAVITAFCFCLDLKMRGLDPDKILSPKRARKAK